MLWKITVDHTLQALFAQTIKVIFGWKETSWKYMLLQFVSKWNQTMECCACNFVLFLPRCLYRKYFANFIHDQLKNFVYISPQIVQWVCLTELRLITHFCQGFMIDITTYTSTEKILNKGNDMGLFFTRRRRIYRQWKTARAWKISWDIFDGCLIWENFEFVVRPFSFCCRSKKHVFCSKDTKIFSGENFRHTCRVKAKFVVTKIQKQSVIAW